MNSKLNSLLPQTIIIPGSGMFGMLGALFLIIALSYTYFLASSVVYVASTKNLAKDLQTTERQVVTLEGEYLSRSQELSRTSASDRGLTEIKDVHYVGTEATALSMLRTAP